MKKIIAVFSMTLLLASCASVRATKPFTVDLNSPRYIAGSAVIQLDKVLGGIKKQDIDVYYYPDADAICLVYISEFLTFYQFWSRDGREAFITALEHYKEDYEQRNLRAKKSKTKRAYGKAQGYIAWSTLRILSEQARGIATIEFGYTFKDKMPFFSLMQRSAEYKDAESRKTESPNTMLYFTRAQAEDLAMLFDQEYLDKLEMSGGGTGKEGIRDILRNILNVR